MRHHLNLNTVQCNQLAMRLRHVAHHTGLPLGEVALGVINIDEVWTSDLLQIADTLQADARAGDPALTDEIGAAALAVRAEFLHRSQMLREPAPVDLAARTVDLSWLPGEDVYELTVDGETWQLSRKQVEDLHEHIAGLLDDRDNEAESADERRTRERLAEHYGC